MEKRLVTGLLIVFVIMLYVFGSMHFVSADRDDDRDDERNDDREDERGDDSSDANAAADIDDRDEFEGDASSTEFRTREEANIVGSDGIERRVEVRERVGADGEIEKRIRVKESEEDGIEVEVEDELEVEYEEEDGEIKLKVKTNNGRFSDVKVMPDVVSERALERLRLRVCSEENNCTIILKDVGQDDSEEIELEYEVKTRKRVRILGIIPSERDVSVFVDAETGEVRDDAPWWVSFVQE